MKKYLQILTISILFIVISCVSKSKIEPGNYNEKIDGISINYTISGKGPIMIVGHPNSGKIGYELTLKPLEDKFTMVYYDSRGTGKSDAPKKIDDYNNDKLTNEIDLLRRKLGVSQIWLFGHSDQSAVALQYAVEHPQNVLGLILTGTSFIGDMDETIKRRKDTENKRKNESAWFLQVVEDWEYMYVNDTDKDKNGRDLSDAPFKWWTYDQETFEKVKPIIKRIAEEGRRKPIAGKSYYETQTQRQKYLDIQKKFKTLQTKSLIINGKFDTNNPPKFAEELQRNLPNSKLILIDKAGHFPWVEQPEKTFEEINRWLNN
ncbi:alpha/beta hydrolase [Kaistella flava (ex Peng et al. 2021)]|uniref:Alpha/beta hydrolase n=1 Tax=Kaistella flava (ex Peng et al. 2021) TaxID=2038776 RepID=A0A7M2Y612_9FLAO|nr:alpha/beta hydrolase [Kaistella flava (ex Peng et al. 2021)]QOW08872.1 alpha/beta hydrolase [Kaistella flava (ex Peng et al. 2021)]